MNKMAEKLQKKDILLLLIIASIGIVLLMIYFVMPDMKKGTVIVTVGTSTYGTYSLEENQVIDVKDEHGHIMNQIIITDHKVAMVKATCPDLLCVKQGYIEQEGKTIVCLPNKVTVTLKSNDSTNSFDSIAQ